MWCVATGHTTGEILPLLYLLQSRFHSRYDPFKKFHLVGGMFENFRSCVWPCKPWCSRRYLTNSIFAENCWTCTHLPHDASQIVMHTGCKMPASGNSPQTAFVLRLFTFFFCVTTWTLTYVSQKSSGICIYLKWKTNPLKKWTNGIMF